MARILTYVEDTPAVLIPELSKDHGLIAPVFHITVFVPPVSPVGPRVGRNHVIGVSRTFDGKTRHVGTTITIKGCAQVILGDAKLVGNLVHVDFHFGTIVGVGTEIELHGVFQNEVGVDTFTLGLLDGVLTSHLCYLVVR